MDIYCVKCKRKTATRGLQKKLTKNGRYYLSGTCTSCGRKKSRFISMKGHGLIGKALGLKNGKIPILGDIPLLGALF